MRVILSDSWGLFQPSHTSYKYKLTVRTHEPHDGIYLKSSQAHSPRLWGDRGPARLANKEAPACAGQRTSPHGPQNIQLLLFCTAWPPGPCWVRHGWWVDGKDSPFKTNKQTKRELARDLWLTPCWSFKGGTNRTRLGRGWLQLLQAEQRWGPTEEP